MGARKASKGAGCPLNTRCGTSRALGTGHKTGGGGDNAEATQEKRLVWQGLAGLPGAPLPDGQSHTLISCSCSFPGRCTGTAFFW